MKKILLPTILLLAGCAVPIEKYDLSTSAKFPPIQAASNITNIELAEFSYEPPHVQISQNTISHLGCFPCKADGSLPGRVFSNKISEIVQAEVRSALEEVSLKSSTNICKLAATIHMAAFDVGDGDTTVDLTYSLIKNENIKYIKRIKSVNDINPFNIYAAFNGTPNRALAESTRNSVRMLLNDNGFNKTLVEHCTAQ